MTDKPLTLQEARDATADAEKIAQLIDWPDEAWGGNCHAVSIALLRTGLVGPGRIARGWAARVMSQHSWIVLGDDCYDPDAVVVDPTYYPAVGRPDGEPLILVDYAANLDRSPHGSGDIFESNRPSWHGGPYIELTPQTPLSEFALAFLDLLGPLDRQGWFELANSPVGGWPAEEIMAAIDDTPQLAAAVPIDILGMVTDRNPKGLYR